VVRRWGTTASLLEEQHIKIRQWRRGEMTFKKCSNESFVTKKSVLMTAL
jgi:hypothetical protein